VGLLVEGFEGCIGPSGMQLCLWQKSNRIMQHMHGNIHYMFDCWADLVVLLLQLKTSLAKSFLGQKLSMLAFKMAGKSVFEILVFPI